MRTNLINYCTNTVADLHSKLLDARPRSNFSSFSYSFGELRLSLIWKIQNPPLKQSYVIEDHFFGYYIRITKGMNTPSGSVSGSGKVH